MNFTSTQMPSLLSNTFGVDKKDVIKREMSRLLDVGFIKEVYHPDWLANPVLVNKKNKH
jgi:hypothetical protein